MYVATRPVTETQPDGSVYTHPEGSYIAEFPSWNNAVKAALLRMGYVREATDIQDGAESVTATPVAAPIESPKAMLVVQPAPLGGQPDAPSCPQCPGKSFANTQGLRLHMTRMHPRPAIVPSVQP